MAIVDPLLPEFDHEMTATRKLLERVPEDRFGWKPHEKSYVARPARPARRDVPMWGSITIESVGARSRRRGNQLPAVTNACGTPRALRRSRRGYARGARREIRRRTDGAVDAQTR